MAYEHREGQGSLFKNSKKEEGSKQPDYRGDALVNGVLMEIAAWVKEGANGGRFFSLAIKPREAREPREETAPKKTGGKFDVLEDDLPF